MKIKFENLLTYISKNSNITVLYNTVMSGGIWMELKDILLKNKKRFIKILSVLVIAVLAVVLIKPVKSFLNEQNALTSEKYTVLNIGKSINSINAKGEIDTLDDDVKIYGDANVQTFKISKVNYEVGDIVNEGDVLAELDSSDLEKDIQESKEKLKTAKSERACQLSIKENQYRSLQYKYDNNLNATVNEYEGKVQAAKIGLDEKKRIYDQNKALFEGGAIPDEQIMKSKAVLDDAQNTYDKAVLALESAKKDVESTLVTAKSEYESAKAVNDDKSDDIDIEVKEKQLSNCRILAAKSGTITKVNAKEGSLCGSADLFEIEDLNNLIAKVDVKEKDISNIKVDQKAEISTDSLGDEKLTGTVIKIEPVAKDEDDDPLSLKDDDEDEEAEFIVKIKFDDMDEKLKSGMNADVDIIIDEKDDIFKVPNSCIVKDGDKNYNIYVAEKEGDHYIIKNVPVTKGIESDTEVEIYGQDIKEGLIVLNSPTDYKIGNTINIKDEH